MCLFNISLSTLFHKEETKIELRFEFWQLQDPLEAAKASSHDLPFDIPLL